MRRLLSVLAASVLFTGPALAHKLADPAEDSIWVGTNSSFMSWRPVARDQLVVWAGPSRAYLVKIWRPSQSLRFVDKLGVTRTGGRVTAFDQVIVEGQRLPIKSIRRIDPEIAREMSWRS